MQGRTSTRILLVDDHSAVRDGIAMLLSNHPEFAVVEAVGTAAAGLDAARSTQLDMVICDLQLGEGYAFPFFEALHLHQPQLPILVFSMHSDHALVKRCLECGVKGYITKTAATPDFLSAVREVANGGSYLLPRLAFEMLQQKGREAGPVQPTLSEREREMLEAIIKGEGNQAIADRLSLSLSSVKTHLRSLFGKLDARDRTQALVNASKRGYLVDQELKMP